MYKTHIKQWGLDKKNKEVEMRAIVRKNKQRADQGKDSTIRIRGQLRDFAEVVRYWDRKGVLIDDIIARQTSSPTPEAVECFTPIPSPISTPPVLAIPERILCCVRDYFKGSFESGTWVKTEPLSHCNTIKDEEGANFYVKELMLECYLACSLFSRNRFEEAGQTLNAASAKIKTILLAEHPQCLGDLLWLITDLRRRKRDEIALIIIRQFSALGKVVLGREHPLSRVCEWIVSAYASGLDDVIIRCTENMADHFESFVGPLHRSTLLSRLHSINIAGPGGAASVQKLQKIIGECEERLDPYDVRILLVRGWLADEYFAHSHFVEAQILSQKNTAHSQHVQSIYPSLYDREECAYMAARCQYAAGEMNSRIGLLHFMINSRLSIYGPEDCQTRYWLLHLES